MFTLFQSYLKPMYVQSIYIYIERISEKIYVYLNDDSYRCHKYAFVGERLNL